MEKVHPVQSTVGCEDAPGLQDLSRQTSWCSLAMPGRRIAFSVQHEMQDDSKSRHEECVLASSEVFLLSICAPKGPLELLWFKGQSQV